MGGPVALEIMPRHKIAGHRSKPANISSISPRKKHSPAVIFKQPRTKHDDIPFRLRKNLVEMSTSPPTSPKQSRSANGSDNYSSRHLKLKEKDLPSQFKGLKPTERSGLDKIEALKNMKRAREVVDEAEDFYGSRMKIPKLDDTNYDESTRRLQVANWTDIIRRRKEMSRYIKADLSKMPATNQRGMNNITGVLCYRISLLQSLLHIPSLVSVLCNYHIGSECTADVRLDCFACMLRNLMRAYWLISGSATGVLFKELHMLIKRRGWTEDGQADPDEQLTFFFRMLREDLPTYVYSMIDSIFASYAHQRITGCACGHISTTTSSQSQLTVCLAPKIQNGTLRQYIIRGSHDLVSYKCEECQSVGQRQKTRFFDDMSEVLCIHFSRRDTFGRKINTNVAIPDTLDLTLLKANKSDINHERFIYELISIVQHAGGNSSGHYICSAEGPDGKWKMFNDNSVSGAQAGAVKQGFTPVLCFFRRIR